MKMNSSSRRKKISAVLFDLDGTLIDSEPNYYLADRILLERYGIPFTPEDKKRYIGGSNIDMMTDLKRRFSLPESAEELVSIKNGIYLEIAEHNTSMYPEMKLFLDDVRTLRIPTAVASGSSPLIISRLLSSLGIEGSFNTAVSAEDVARGKPAPDIFLEAARRLGIPPCECLVMEDSQYGVESAHSAGMSCAAIPYLTEKPLPAVFSLADVLFEEGMSGFSAAQMTAWLTQSGMLPRNT